VIFEGNCGYSSFDTRAHAGAGGMVPHVLHKPVDVLGISDFIALSTAFDLLDLLDNEFCQRQEGKSFN
jgi:hypothetical protein